MSNNGWPNDPPDLVEVGVPGVSDTGAVRAGAVARLFQAFLHDFHTTVEPLVTINGYRSYALNKQSGGIETSNHRSGTAMDLNGYRHPYEPSAPKPYNDGFTDAQTLQIRRLLSKYGGTLRWGMDFAVGYKDAMHFEIRGSSASVTEVANLIIIGGSIPTAPGINPIAPPLEADMATLIKISGPDGRRAIYNETVGWVDTTAPGVTEYWIAIGTGLGMVRKDVTVDANGWEMAKAFSVPSQGGHVWNHPLNRPGAPVADAGTFLVDVRRGIDSHAGALADKINGIAPVDIDALADAIVAKLPSIQAGASVEDIVAGVRTALNEAKF